MQIGLLRDNLHEMSKTIFWKKKKKNSKMSSADFFTQQTEADFQGNF